MKTKLVLTVMVALLGAVPLLAQDATALNSFDSSWTLHELAASESVPVKQLATELDLDLEEVRGRSLTQLRVSQRDAEEAVRRYREREGTVLGSIVAVGMIIVFVSLVVVAFLINMFRYFHLFDRLPAKRGDRSVRTVVGTITSKGDMSEQSIAAVVAAIFLHEDDVESENRLLLTWKRASTNIWRTGSAIISAA